MDIRKALRVTTCMTYDVIDQLLDSLSTSADTASKEAVLKHIAWHIPTGGPKMTLAGENGKALKKEELLEAIRGEYFEESPEESAEAVARLIEEIQAGGDVTMSRDLDTDSYFALISDINLDMNGKTLSNLDNTVPFDPANKNTNKNQHGILPNKVTCTIANGKVEGNFNGIQNQWSKVTLENMEVYGAIYAVNNSSVADTTVIKSGKYVGGMSSAVQVEGGKVVIKGGEFSAAQDPKDVEKGKNFTLNVMDSLLKKNDGKKPIDFIEVRGGRFFQFDPANALTEPAPFSPCSFVAPGYKSVKDGDWYEVVEDPDYSEDEENSTATVE